MEKVTRQGFLQSNVQDDDASLIIGQARSTNDKVDLNKTCEGVHVCILGSGGVGKTAITQRYLHDTFVQNWEATIEDAYRKKVRVDNQPVTLDITDTAGQEDFSSLRPQWMMGKDGYIFVYSLVDNESLEHLYSYIELLEQVTVGLQYIPPAVFIGNKKDLVDRDPEARSVSKADVEKLIAKFKECSERARMSNGMAPSAGDNDSCEVFHFEASAYSGERIQETFEFLIRDIRRLRRSPAVVDNKTCCAIQ